MMPNFEWKAVSLLNSVHERFTKVVTLATATKTTNEDNFLCICFLWCANLEGHEDNNLIFCVKGEITFHHFQMELHDTVSLLFSTIG